MGRDTLSDAVHTREASAPISHNAIPGDLTRAVVAWLVYVVRGNGDKICGFEDICL